MKKNLFFTYVVLFCAVFVHAQKDSTTVTNDETPLIIRQISNDDLQKFKNDNAYNYEIVKNESSWFSTFTNWLSNLFKGLLERLFGVEKAAGFFTILLRILPYLLLGILIFLFIKFFLAVNAQTLLQAKNAQNAVGLSEEEKLMKSEDLQQLKIKALADKNYRLAIRYYYLLVLQQMTTKEIISWEIQKTNDDYLREIKRDELRQPFGAITRWYEYIWYGDFPIDSSKYVVAEMAFAKLQKILDGDG